MPKTETTKPEDRIYLAAKAEKLAIALDHLLGCRLTKHGLETTPDILAEAGHALAVWKGQYD